MEVLSLAGLGIWHNLGLLGSLLDLVWLINCVNSAHTGVNRHSSLSE